MGDLLTNLLAFPPERKVNAKEYDRLAIEYVKYLHDLPAREWSKQVDKQNILDLLDPAVNSIPYLFAINAQNESIGKDRSRAEEAVTRSVVFFTSFDPIQVRYAGDAWRILMDWAFILYPQVGVRDFSPLSTAMLRLDPTAGTFTSHHLRFVRLCVESAVPSQALRILDHDIYAYPQSSPNNVPHEILCDIHPDELSNAFITPKSGLTIWPLKSEYILEYYLLGAHVYLGLRSYSRARLFLEYVLLHPSPSAHATSAFQVEAYKKYLLLGLLTNGKDYGLPRTHDAQVMRGIRACSKAYEALVDSFERRDWRKFDAELDAGTQIWADDGNVRLVQDCLQALMRYRVMDLQKTFAALPVSRVALHLEWPVERTLDFLQTLISENTLSATIEQATGAADAVLHFDTVKDRKLDHAIDLAEQTKRIESLIAFVRDADRRLQLTKEYVDHQKRTKRSGPDADLAEQMDLTWDAPIGGMDDDGDGDEDIMAA